MNPSSTARPFAASSSRRSKTTPRPATTAAPSPSATATAISATTVETAWDVADGPAAFRVEWHRGPRRDRGAFYCASGGRWIHASEGGGPSPAIKHLVGGP